MRHYKITKTFNSLEEINNSAEYKELWEGYRMIEQKDHDDVKFIKAFQIEDGRLLVIREMTKGKDSGLRMLQKLSVSSCLDNNPFLIGFVSEDSLIFVNDENAYDRSNHNRIQFAGHCKKFQEAFVTTNL